MNIEVIKRIKDNVTKHQRQGETPNRITIITNTQTDIISLKTAKENRRYIDEDLGCVVLDTVNEFWSSHNIKYIDIKEIAVINFQYSIPEHHE